MASGLTQNFISGATTNVTSAVFKMSSLPAGACPSGVITFQASVAGTGSVSVTATPYGSNDGTNWVAQTALSPSGTNSGTAGLTVTAAYAQWRVVLTNITGTGATVSVVAGF